MLKICIVSFSQLSSDGRVLRQIESLSRIGRVTTIGYGTQPPFSSEHHSIPFSSRYLPLTFIGIMSLLTRRFDFAYRQTKAVQWSTTILHSLNVDVVVFNDVQTIGLSKIVSGRSSVVIDMHEYAPEEMSDDWRFRLLLRRYYQYLCSLYLGYATLSITVSPSIAAEFERTLGTKFVVIRNSCNYYELPMSSTMRGRIKLVHAGLASKGRHLEIMIDAVRELPNMQLDLYLVPAPRQHGYYRQLKKKISKVPNVRLCPPVSSSNLVPTLNKYDVGLLVINPSNFSLANCLPNKLFEYIQARLMVISGPTPDIRTIIGQYDIGEVIGSYSSDDLKKCLAALSREKISEYKINADYASKFVDFKFESEKLSSLVRDLPILNQ